MQDQNQSVIFHKTVNRLACEELETVIVDPEGRLVLLSKRTGEEKDTNALQRRESYVAAEVQGASYQ